nr:MAG TPA_asm: hypothetical protein [Caudoviricetes sp.]
MADFNITDRYQETITSVIKGEDFNAFPLLARVKVQDANVLQSFQVVDKQAVNFETEVINGGLTSEVTFDDAGDITVQAIQQAVQHVTRDLYKQVEKGLVDKAKTFTGKYVQGVNDIMLTKDNDFVALAIPVFEVDYFAESDDFKSIVINPDTALLIGSLTPEIVIKKDVRKNKVKVFGTLSVAGGWFGNGVVKKIGGTA